MWDPASGLLHYIDNTGQKVHSCDPETGEARTLTMPSVITTLVLREGGGAVVTLRSGIHFLDLESGALELVSPLADPPPHVFNDGKVDARGRFMIGASTANFADPGPDGGLFRLDPDHKLHPARFWHPFLKQSLLVARREDVLLLRQLAQNDLRLRLRYRDRFGVWPPYFRGHQRPWEVCPTGQPSMRMGSTGSPFIRAARSPPSGRMARSNGRSTCR